MKEIYMTNTVSRISPQEVEADPSGLYPLLLLRRRDHPGSL